MVASVRVGRRGCAGRDVTRPIACISISEARRPGQIATTPSASRRPPTSASRARSGKSSGSSAKVMVLRSSFSTKTGR
ncbi:hypothetical protein DIE28_14205 [Paracoccus thiocyanatus]|uniref:Uncharacterized protein n=1 Tax=Paracoccus thiocyanatus TaxID=34006 RepID=A0A3D8PB01_9RHOB|nr:hypothetical protein DIE28_14205 [Paracoccus thiocyanatus]